MLSKDELLGPLAAQRRSEVVVTTMGVVRPWGRYSSHPLDFASGDSAMAHAADFALGIALAQPERRVWCLNGDGSMLMSLGTLVTIVESGAANLMLFVLQNDAYEVTGNQKVPGAGRVDFAAMARAAGFAHAHFFEDPKLYAAAIPQILAGPGPVCVVAKVARGAEGPLARRPAEEAVYLRTSLAESARTVRRALLEGR
jgi:sulfopyruvate decarboxylase subunit beta